MTTVKKLQIRTNPSLKNALLGHNFKMVMASLIEHGRFRTKFQNDYGILKSEFVIFPKN